MPEITVDRRERTTPPARGRRNHVSGLAAGGALNIIGAIVNQVSLFGVTVLLARTLGRHDVGVYSQAFAVRALLQLVCLGGMRSALTRYVALYLADGDAAAVRGTVRFGMAMSLVASSLLAVALFVASPFLAHSVFHQRDLAGPLELVALSLPAAVVTVAALSATQGFRTMRPYSIAGSIFEPMLRLVLTAILVAAGAGIGGAMVALLVASVATAVLSWWWLLRLMSDVPAATPRYERAEIRRFARVSWASSIANQGLLWADIVILGVLVPAGDIGVYQVATRLVMLAGIAVNPLNASFAPRAADLWRRNDLDTLRRSYLAISGWSTRLCIPVVAVLVVFPDAALRIFGHGFRSGVGVILLFLVGQLVDAAASPAAIVLNMAGRNFLNMIDSLGALALNVGLNFALVPHFGIEGSAVAWSAALIALGAARVVQSRLVVGAVHPLTPDTVKALAAGVVAVLAAGAVRVVVPAPLALVLVAGTVVAFAVYAAVVATLGMAADDRALADELRARLRMRRALA